MGLPSAKSQETLSSHLSNILVCFMGVIAFLFFLVAIVIGGLTASNKDQ